MAKGRKAQAAGADEQMSEVLSRIETLDGTLALAEARLDELESEREALASQLASSEQELDLARERCESLEASSDAAALAVVRLEDRIDALEHELEQARRELVEYLPAIAERSVAADAGTLEHSPGRQQAEVNRIVQLATEDRLSDALAARRDAIEDCLAWFVAPPGRLAEIGDGDPRLELPASSENPHLALAAGGRGKAPAATCRAFPQSGWFVVRAPVPGARSPLSSCSYLLQICGRHSSRYKHDDDFAFVWFEGSVEILADGGRCQVTGGPAREYTESIRAHNVATIDEAAEDRARAGPFGSGLKQSGEARQLYFSECERIVGNVSHVRVLAFRPTLWVAVIDIFHDREGGEHEFAQRFLLGPELDATETDGAVSAKVGNQQSVHTIPFFEATLAGVWRAQQTPEMEAWSASPSGELAPATAVRFTKAGSRELMATVFWIGEGPPVLDAELTRANATARRIRLGWTGDGRKHQIDVVREDGLEVRYRAPSVS